MLRLSQVSVKYGTLFAVNSVSLEARPFEVVALVGPNGAGKTSVAGAIAGMVPTAAGSIEIAAHGGTNKALEPESTWRRARRGILFLPADRPVFSDLTIAENILIALASIPVAPAAKAHALATTYQVFPMLTTRSHHLAGVLSGGERRLLGMARICAAAWAFHASGVCKGQGILLIDEPTRGLHAGAIQAVEALLSRLAALGFVVLIMEQTMPFALRVATRLYVMRAGRIVAAGAPDLIKASLDPLELPFELLDTMREQ